MSHNLYKERELNELKTRFAGYVAPSGSDDDTPAPVIGTGRPAAAAATGARIVPPGVTADQFAELTVDVAELRAEVARLKDQVQSLDAKLQAVLS